MANDPLARFTQPPQAPEVAQPNTATEVTTPATETQTPSTETSTPTPQADTGTAADDSTRQNLMSSLRILTKRYSELLFKSDDEVEDIS
jgi:hypothetical protein